MKNKNDKRVEWVYNFIDGGWNSEWAVTREEAIAKAQDRKLKSEIDLRSFRTVSAQEMTSLLNQFN